MTSEMVADGTDETVSVGTDTVGDPCVPAIVENCTRDVIACEVDKVFVG